MTPQEVEEIVDQYIMNGPDEEIVGLRGRACLCPVAEAIKKSKRESFSDLSVNDRNIFIYIPDEESGKKFSYIILNSQKVATFIAFVDSFSHLEVSRKQAQMIWKSL